MNTEKQKIKTEFPNHKNNIKLSEKEIIMINKMKNKHTKFIKRQILITIKDFYKNHEPPKYRLSNHKLLTLYSDDMEIFKNDLSNTSNTFYPALIHLQKNLSLEQMEFLLIFFKISKNITTQNHLFSEIRNKFKTCYNPKYISTSQDNTTKNNIHKVLLSLIEKNIILKNKSRKCPYEFNKQCGIDKTLFEKFAENYIYGDEPFKTPQILTKMIYSMQNAIFNIE